MNAREERLKKSRLSGLMAACAALVAMSVFAQASGAGTQEEARVEVQWLGQSAFRITTTGGKVIVTDPWLVKNPLTPARYKNLDNLGKVDLLLVTHGHADHIADAPEIARKNGIPMYAPGDLNMALTTLGVLPPAQLPRLNKSGRITPLPGIKVTATTQSTRQSTSGTTPPAERMKPIRVASRWATSSSWKTASASGTWAIPGSSAT